ncbi:MAG: multidrug effflux MFS transporter [Dactylosporangium sp.]|nr:multidrug effflux MFS transporter [Dactylosporangium sp.]NNJ62374.1 multidrug effflux MFS transporter [Dactylosporangium sp.]
MLGALSTFGPLSLDMYLPALPQIARDLHASQALTQLTLSSCLAGLALGQLVAGPISDAVGRRRPMIAGVAMFALLSLGCAVAPSAPLLVGIRFLQGLGGAAGLVVARAIVRDVFPGARAARVFASLMLVSGLAPIVAPVLGGQLLRWTDWRGVFVALAAIGVVLVLAAVRVPETLPPAARRSGGLTDPARMFRTLVTDLVFMGYALSTGFAGAAMFTYISTSSFVLQSGYGVSPRAFSLIFASNAAGLMLAGQISARLVGWLGPRRLYVSGLAAVAAGAVSLVVVIVSGLPLAAVLATLFIVVASQGLTMPNGTALALAPYGQAAGSASAQFGVQQFLIAAIISPLAGLGGASALVMAMIMAGVALLGVLICQVATRGVPAATP